MLCNTLHVTLPHMSLALVAGYSEKSLKRPEEVLENEYVRDLTQIRRVLSVFICKLFLTYQTF